MAQPDSGSTKAKLRKLRDKLSFEGPRARARPGTPPELIRRLQTTLELLSAACMLGQSEAEEEVCEDALVEAHLVLHDWERVLEQAEGKPKPAPVPSAADRRFIRQETSVSVKVSRHAVHEGAQGPTLSTEITSRPARNVSAGGMFVTGTKEDFPGLGSGSVVHVSVSFADSPTFQTRAVVTRRDEHGLGLRWLQETAEIKQSIQRLLHALGRSRP
jgi:hypothetical protein